MAKGQYRQCKNRVDRLFGWQPGLFWTSEVGLNEFGRMMCSSLTRRQVLTLARLYKERHMPPPGTCEAELPTGNGAY